MTKEEEYEAKEDIFFIDNVLGMSGVRPKLPCKECDKLTNNYPPICDLCEGEENG